MNDNWDRKKRTRQRVTDRAYWENHGTKATVAIADQLLDLLHEFDPNVELKFNKFYIGLSRQGQADNFVIFRAMKKFLSLEPRIQESDELTKSLDESGLTLLDYDSAWRRYRIRLTPPDVCHHRDLLRDVLKQAYQQANE